MTQFSNIKNEIADSLKKSLSELGYPEVEVGVERAHDERFGDYSTNIALVLSKKLKKSPKEIAHNLVSNFQFSIFPSISLGAGNFQSNHNLQFSKSTKLLEKAEVVNGFINFTLSKEYLVDQLGEVLRLKEEYGRLNQFSGKKIMVEFAHPNTHKMFHIGHLRNITTGECVVRMLEANGAEVVRANYQGDVGVHIAKCLYGILKFQIPNSKLQSNHNFSLGTARDLAAARQFSNEKSRELVKELEGQFKTVIERVEFLGKCYTEGNRAYEEDETAKKEIMDINRKIYIKDPEVFELWKTTRQWSLDYFENIYKRVYSHFDRYYFESEVYERGRELVLEGLKKGIFEESEGAIIFRGEKFGLHNRVFVTKEGNATYEAKDMGLGEMQFKEYNPDLIVHNVGPEQGGYFQVMFEALAKLFPKTSGKEKHLIYGWVKLKSGKMSSREGNVVLGEWLLDEAKARIKQMHGDVSEGVAEKASVAAVKYSFLRTGLPNEIAFDIEESVNFNGDSGPYLMYTYARCRSVIAKLPITNYQLPNKFKFSNINDEELAVLRLLQRFPEVVAEAGRNYSPSTICSYLYDLAQKFNLFYNRHRIIDGEEVNQFRLALTTATGTVIKSGLNLLGIEVSERM